MPSTEELKGFMGKFDSNTLQQIESKVREAALSEGVFIAKWDKEWEKYHLYDDSARLIKVLIEKKRSDLFHSLQSEQKRTVDLLIDHCPLAFENLILPSLNSELLIKVEQLKLLSDQELKELMGEFDSNTLQQIESNVKEAALSEGVLIAKWDKEWGKYHLYDDSARLIKVLIEKKRSDLFHSLQSEQKRTVDLLIDHCPLAFENLFSPSLSSELLIRGKLISLLGQLKIQWNTFYPQSQLCYEVCDARSRLWKAKEIALLTCPTLDKQSVLRISNFLQFVQQILKEGDKKASGILLDCTLQRECIHPTQADISNHLTLRSMEKMVLEMSLGNSLHTASESLWKGINVVPSYEDKQAKFKSLSKDKAAKEIFGFQFDRILGFSMTAPTKYMATSVPEKLSIEVKNQLLLAKCHEEKDQSVTAMKYRQRAFDLFNHNLFPAELRRSLFYELYRLYGENHDTPDLGEKLFYNYGGFSTTDSQKVKGFQNCLNSRIFKQHFLSSKMEGSLQLWKNNCPRVYDLIVKNPNGGALLKSAPKIVAHLYALLGILKGSKDCSSGNTLAVIDPITNTITNFWDFDDELSMPVSNNFWDLRMWQFGLPQCAQPFDRSTLLLFSDQKLLKKLEIQQARSGISKEACQLQLDRLSRIIHLFQEELKKDQPTLTPRELFFILFGGRDDFARVKQAFNNNRAFGEEGIRISAIELFEFQLPEMGRHLWYTADENEKTLVGRNMRALYSPDLP